MLPLSLSGGVMNHLEKYLEYAMNKKKNGSVVTGLSTGSTLLNLACSNHPEIGFLCGKYHFLVGDSASGKTFLTLTCFAEACRNELFKDYLLIYDDVEGGNLFDIEKLFGKSVSERVIAPDYTKQGEPLYSNTIEEFYYNVSNRLEDGVPFIYVLDSMDGLSSKQELEKFEDEKDAFFKDKKITGSMGDGKAKVNSSKMRQLMPLLRDSQSILIVINQTRDNLGFGFEKKTRSGGHALRFYATLEIWSSIQSKIKKTVNKKERTLGINAKLAIKKNRITGAEHSVTVPIYYSYGIDDITSCIDYLLEENYWEVKKQTIHATDFSITGTRDTLIKEIEKNNLAQELSALTGKVWNDVQKECKLERSPRYT